MLYAQEKAQWRILLVREAKGEEKEAPSCFILCSENGQKSSFTWKNHFLNAPRV